MMDTTFIIWLQQFSNEFLDLFFTTITKIGNPEYYMVVIPLIYWCVSKRQGFRFAVFFLIATYTNSLIKGITNVPRPPADQVRVLYEESTLGSTSFPSGHTQGTASFWGYASHYYKSKAFTIFSIIIIALVGLSRIYLGLHYPIDVVVGLLLALVIIALFNIIYEPIAQVLGQLPLGLKLLLSMSVPALLLLLPGYDKGMLIGFTIGLLVGYQLEGEYVQFEVRAPFIKQVMKFVIGSIGFFGLRVGLKTLFTEVGLSEISPLAADVLRYAIIGLWAAYVAPWIFVKLGLSRRKRIDMGRSTLQWI